MPKKPRVLLDGLATTWDTCAVARKNLREQGEILLCGGEVSFKPTAASCSLNMEVLVPVLDLLKKLG